MMALTFIYGGQDRTDLTIPGRVVPRPHVINREGVGVWPPPVNPLHTRAMGVARSWGYVNLDAP